MSNKQAQVAEGIRANGLPDRSRNGSPAKQVDCDESFDITQGGNGLERVLTGFFVWRVELCAVPFEANRNVTLRIKFLREDRAKAVVSVLRVAQN